MDEKRIRKLYGEKMWHFCRDNFSTILEEEGKLVELLTKTFYPSHTLYDDIENDNKLKEFKDYIYFMMFYEKRNITKKSVKTPEELLSIAGYNLYECTTEEDIQSFKKYYKENEELCTFKGRRLDTCYVFFAVKKNVNEIKREDFKYPSRQDEYGTSVISIQFTRDNSHTLSIKNRYNHTVTNPDATFSNNLDNIIPNLTDSFEIHYGLKQLYLSTLELKNYVKSIESIHYKYNHEINNIYYCKNNIILNNYVKDTTYIDKSRYIVFDYFILDKKEKKLIKYDYCLEDCFFDIEKNIERIEEVIENNNKKIILYHKEGISTITINEDNQIIEYSNPYIEEIGDYFLTKCHNLKKINLPNVTIVGRGFLNQCDELEELSLPNAIKIGSDFGGSSIEKINLPNVEVIDEYFLSRNNRLKEINLPNVKIIKNNFLIMDTNLEELSLPNVQTIGRFFLTYNKKLKKLILPNLKSVGDFCLSCNEQIEEVETPVLEDEGQEFLSDSPYRKKRK